MTTFETWSLVISAFAALGTVGAVAIALWATLHRRRRFVVKDINVQGLMEVPRESDTKQPIMKEASVHFLLENRQQFQIEVISITLMLSKPLKKGQTGATGTGIGEILRGNFIPAQSQYAVKLDVLGKKIPFSKQDVGKITCEIKTSAGDVVVPFPEKWRSNLFNNLVFDEKE